MSGYCVLMGLTAVPQALASQSTVLRRHDKAQYGNLFWLAGHFCF